MKKILVAVDDSNYSRKVFDYFVDRAKKLEDQLTFFHVVRAPKFYDSFAGEAIDEEIEEAEEFTREMKYDAQEIGIEADSEVITDSNIATGIIKFANENNYDMIGIGAKGKSNLGTIHLGSVTEEVVTRAHCPVLIVR